MPGRKDPIITGETYHVFNRGIAKGVTFSSNHEYGRAVATISYYSFPKIRYSLSRLFRFDTIRRNEILATLDFRNKPVQVQCYCLMPNHFHLVIKQLADGGISKFFSDIQNSYTRYYNTLHNRDGSLFLNQFKAVQIETENQLIHVSRYIHLNPFVAGIVKELDNLPGYPWSSLSDYVDENKSNFVETDPVLGLFRSPNAYKKFVFDQANYARNLKRNEKLLLDFG